MNGIQDSSCRRPAQRTTSTITTILALSIAAALSGCGGKAGSTGSVENSGPAKTSLRVEASDADGDALQYQWRATAGSIENRNSRETVWTMPDGPGLHFAYVVISDGKGGHVEQQYAVSSDALGTNPAPRAPITRTAAAVTDFSGAPVRVRFQSPDQTMFASPGGGPAVRRTVYLPDVQVQVLSGTTVVFSGASDLSGEVSLPKLSADQTYHLKCATTQGVVLTTCENGFEPGAEPIGFKPGTEASVIAVAPPLPEGRNLRRYGHVALADGAVCGAQSEFFGVQTAATVQLLQSDGALLGPAVRVNRFGDYAVDAAVAVQARPGG